MKVQYFLILVLIVFLSSMQFVRADGSINAFYKANVSGTTVEQLSIDIKSELESSGFKILGEYNPKKDDNLVLITFTNDQLIDIALQTKDRGLLAGILRVGLIGDGEGNVQISFLNPMYTFYSFLREDVKKNQEALNNISMQAMISISSVGAGLIPFGSGSLTESELINYKYMVRMPGFDEPVELRKFSSFQEGVNIMKRNLRAHKGGTSMVYEYISQKDKVAIFGVALHDSRLGEAKFLPILGEDNLAAMPYEVVLQGNTAMILNGRYRFPLFWSHLSMREFQKIGRTNRDIEYMLQGITK